MSSRYCTYCGDAATQFDHVLPVSYTHGTRKGTTRFCYLVPSCSECNLTLSDHVFKDGVRSRADYLAGAYRKKYKKEFSKPFWTEEELSDMSYMFRSMIAEQQNVVTQQRRRMDTLSVVATLGEEALELFDYPSFAIGETEVLDKALETRGYFGAYYPTSISPKSTSVL